MLQIAQGKPEKPMLRINENRIRKQLVKKGLGTSWWVVLIADPSVRLWGPTKLRMGSNKAADDFRLLTAVW